MHFKSRFALATCSAAIAVGLSGAAHAGDIAGSVVDSSGTAALQAAEITIEELNRSAISERDGSFTFFELPAGTYTLVTRYVGAEAVRTTVTVPATGTVPVEIVLGGDDAGTILVIGQSANQASALSRKRASDTVSDVLTRDAIGQFPDQNVAESLRRLPGINVLNDQGEGRFVSVRGLDPDLNSTSLNGVRLPSPEGDVRSVALDVVSSDIIESIEVKKSLTPDMDGDTIGASIEIETTSAFDRKKDLYTAKLEGSYNEFSDTLTPKGSFDFAARLTDSFGVSGGVSYYRREFETDNIEADDYETDANGPFATETQFRDYDVERERISATLGFDAKLGNFTELYLKGVFSQFDDQEFRRRLTFDLSRFDESGPTARAGSVATYSDAANRISVERDVKDRFERQRIASLVFGGESDWDNWFAEYSLAYSKASEREDGSLDPTQFRQRFTDTGLNVAIDTTDPKIPAYAVSGQTADFFDPSRYELNDVELTALSDAEDREWAGKVDVGRRFYSDNGTFTVQAGYKGRWRDKSFDKNVEFYEADDYTLADVLGEQTYRLGDISPVPDGRLPTLFFNANRDLFELQELDSQFDSGVEDFSVEENINAAYLLGRWDTSTLRVIAGVRYEHTSNDVLGNTVTLAEEGATLPDGTIAADDTVVIDPVRFTRDYDDFLPSINVRYEAAPDLILRLAGYRSLVRPKLSKLAPRFAIEQNDDDDREGEFGNPDLVPYKAWNFDASAEFYMSSNGALTAAVFYKDVENFIVDVNVDEPGVFSGLAFDEATIPINGPSGQIFGIELGASQSLNFLPGLLGGFLVSANYTFTDADGSVPVGDFTDLTNVDTFRDIQLPAASRHTFNAALGYERGPVSLRLAGTYRSRYLDEINSDADLDRYVDDHFQLDLTAKYKINDRLKLFYEWVNINNADFYAYNELGGQRNLYQFEEYGYTMKFGARVTF